MQLERWTPRAHGQTRLLLMCLALSAALPAVAAARHGSETSLVPPALAPMPPDSPFVDVPTEHAESRFGGRFTLNLAASGGTQRQNSATGTIALFHEGGLDPRSLHTNIRLNGDFGYGTGQKPDQPKIVTNEMLYGEFRPAVDARQLFSLFGGSLAERPADGTTRTWLYGIASGYHHIAFALRSEQAYGLGLSHDIAQVPGLVVAVDLRHINEVFDGQPSFSSWAVRVHETFSITWKVGPPDAQRSIIIAESIEVIPAFESAKALQARALARLSLPIVAGLTTDVTYGLDYMRNAPPKSKPRYWKATLGFGYQFSREKTGAGQ